MVLRFTSVLFVFAAVIVSILGRDIARCNDCRFWPGLEIFRTHEKSTQLVPSEIIRQETPKRNFAKDHGTNLKALGISEQLQKKVKKLKRAAVGEPPESSVIAETTVSDSVATISSVGSLPTTATSMSLILENGTTAATISPTLTSGSTATSSIFENTTTTASTSVISENATTVTFASSVPENATTVISISTILGGATTATSTGISENATTATSITSIPSNTTIAASMSITSATPIITKNITDSLSSLVSLSTTEFKSVSSEGATTSTFTNTILENATATKIVTDPSLSIVTEVIYPSSSNTTPTAATNPTPYTTATPSTFSSPATSATTILFPSSLFSTIQSSSIAIKNDTKGPNLFPTSVPSSTELSTFPSSVSTTTLQQTLHSIITTSAQPTTQTNTMKYINETSFETTTDEADTTSEYDEYDYIDTLLTGLLINNQDFKILEKSMEELSGILSCLIKKLLQEDLVEMSTCLTMSDLDVSIQDLLLRLEQLISNDSQSSLLQSIIDYLRNTLLR